MTKLAWPLEWKVLQDIYPVDSWTIESAQEVTEAEQHYDVWVHWHNEGIYIASTESTRNWCPLCPIASEDAIRRNQVPPLVRPFESWDQAKARLVEWIRGNAGIHWMISHQMSDMTGIDMQCRLIKGDSHSTLQHLFLALQADPPEGIQVCAHEKSLPLPDSQDPLTELFWAIATEDTQTPCPFCTMQTPKQSPASLVWDHGRPVGIAAAITKATDLLCEAASPETLYEAAQDVHPHSVTLENLEDIECPDCRRVAEERLRHSPLEPDSPTDSLPF